MLTIEQAQGRSCLCDGYRLCLSIEKLTTLLIEKLTTPGVVGRVVAEGRQASVTAGRRPAVGSRGSDRIRLRTAGRGSGG